MYIQVSHEKGRVPVTVLAIVGDMDASNHEQLDQIAWKEIENGAQYILIDLAGVRFMSSAAFRSIMMIFKKLHSLSMAGSDEEMNKGINAGTYKSPYLKLCKPSERVAEALKVASFDMLLEIHTDMKAAIASF
jgi:anti-anti-sigma factor